MPINEDFILNLIDKFSSAAVAELKLDDGAVHIELRKEAACIPAAAAGPPAGALAAGSPGGTGGAGIEGLHLGLPAVPAKAAGGEAVTSPIVATFYASAQPDAPAFVTVGSRVKSGDTLCILEAMKMMNHLEAEFDCEILSVKASSGDLVEYGQTLFEVKRL
ncbi:MAG: acetyl-CoA carboxylase biotin carboxyl carrier protein [Treponema sp.]|jgi:acetyl-CoA carboxylase biotin carboxyl carrier protein|nr:acetyl-CoA carboxylase biotin carboxyl carrier protein [Treponema sp.]